MTISTKYNPGTVEEKWYRYWMDKGFFHSKPNPDKEPYTIVIPPPNVTGVLHMGHMLNNTIQDVLIRRARMIGYETCWVPGTDHASIATEAKVVRMLREKGIKKSDISREEFLKYAWEWREKYGGIILEQLKKLGASCDWDRTAFTMDEDYYKAVIRVFVDLYKKGYIYRGLRMINWDCEAKTALSNEEVIYNEEGEKSVFYSVKYKIKGEDKHVVIATIRPETILGDTAIAVNPKDKRYKNLIGKKALVPFINREIPIIADDYVEVDFGTGCLKVTPAHDQNDYEIGLRHKLEVIDTINPDGTLNENCEVPEYIGKDRFEVRDLIVRDLKKAGLIVNEEEIVTKIGRSERTNTVVEPRLSLQWFIKMKEISRRAHQAVMDDEIKIYPAKFKNTYNHWMENVRDWCISRQLWWGHRIPAYYYGTGKDDFVVAESKEAALELAIEKTGNKNLSAGQLRQDPDVLDTWASSWLFPIEVFHGFADEYFDQQNGKIYKGKNTDLDYYYPTDTLVTAPEILFFWVARMIISGYEYLNEKPFKNVYLTGIVRDLKGRKMSKSLGNSPEPLELIEKYGADGVRTGMLFSSPAGNDLLFDVKLCEQGRNFSNKIWNAFRLVKGWDTDDNLPMSEGNRVAVDWFRSRFNQVLKEVNDQFSKYRISDALKVCYSFTWNDFCSWYLEMVKPEYQKPIDKNTYEATIDFFNEVIKLLHPFMPFITEEIWHEIKERDENDCIIVATWPEEGEINEKLIKNATNAFEVISQVRNIRNSKNIPKKQSLQLEIKGNIRGYETFMPIILKLANLESFNEIQEKHTGGMGFIIKDDEFIVPVSEGVDLDKERENLEKELEYTLGFKSSVTKKLHNERFVKNAPEKVVELERKKLEDANARIKAIEKALLVLNGK